MGNPKQKWTAEEEETLMAGIRKHGPGKWKAILSDPEFSPGLIYRSNVDLKDKWRNMPAQGLRDYSATPQRQAPATNTSTPKSQTTRKTTSSVNDPPANSRYFPMILEALSPSNSPRGSEFAAIAGFIEKKYDVPDNFRKLLTPELKKLLVQGEIEKVGKRYKIKEVTVSDTQNTPEQKNVVPTQVKQPCATIPAETQEAETVEYAAKKAAYEIANSENKALELAEAVKEYERISQMAAEADAMLIFCQQVFELQVGPS